MREEEIAGAVKRAVERVEARRNREKVQGSVAGLAALLIVGGFLMFGLSAFAGTYIRDTEVCVARGVFGECLAYDHVIEHPLAGSVVPLAVIGGLFLIFGLITVGAWAFLGVPLEAKSEELRR